jgi:glycosyltransferase involved in cell wall biosynthesis
MVSASTSEGFPNVVGEAMACGVPCVVTDVADSRLIVGGTGKVVRPGDPNAIADAAYALLDETSESKVVRAQQVRQRIKANFELKQLAARHYEIWSQFLLSSRNASATTSRKAA